MLRQFRVAAAAVTLVAATVSACGDDVAGGDARIACDLFSDLIVDGGVGRDQIPALTNPAVVTRDSASFMRPSDRVMGVVQNGKARAYPLIVMWWHEIINDTLGGEPVLTTYCPLTGSGLAFDPRVGGTAANFGVSGLLFENNLMMFDRESESLWPQLLHGAACGDQRGTELQRVAVVETTWEAWLDEHPMTTLVSVNTGFDKPYGLYPYGNYDIPDNPVLLAPSSPFSVARPPKDLMLGVIEGSVSTAYPLAVLDSLSTTSVAAFNDTVGSRPIVITYDRESRTAIAFDARVGGVSVVLVSSDSAPNLLEDTVSGSLFTTWGVGVAGPHNGVRLDPLRDSFDIFWFAWAVFHPETRVLQ